MFWKWFIMNPKGADRVTSCKSLYTYILMNMTTARLYCIVLYCICIFQHGKEYNATPARKLSQSFDLDIVGGKAITAKQVGQI